MDFEVFCEKIWGNVRDDNGGVWEAGGFRACGRGERIPTPVCGLARNDPVRGWCGQSLYAREAYAADWLGMTGFFDSLTSLTEGGFGRGQAKYFSLKGMFSTVKVRPRR